MPHNRVRDTSHQSSSYTAQSSAPYHYQASGYLVGQIDDLLGRPTQPDVSLRHGTTSGFDLFHLGIQELLSLQFYVLLGTPDITYPLGGGINVHWYWPSMHDM
jgi:hypothetical protein